LGLFDHLLPAIMAAMSSLTVPMGLVSNFSTQDVLPRSQNDPLSPSFSNSS